MKDFFSTERVTLLYFMDEESLSATGNTRLVKIGQSDNPWRRKEQLQTGNPRSLRIITAALGSSKLETQIQNQFSEQHVRGEWFRINDDLELRMAMMHKYGSPGRVGWQTRKAVSESKSRIRVAVHHDKWGTADKKYDYEVRNPKYYVYMTKLICWISNGGSQQVEKLYQKLLGSEEHLGAPEKLD